jgi:Putative peptidoglycan binding domain
MPESSAAAAAVPTVSVTVKLPQLQENPNLPPAAKAATARVQAIFNDFAKAEHKPRPFGESGAFGDKTEDHVEKFQQKHHISPANGIVDAKTWKALLDAWIKLPPLPPPDD